MPNEVFLRTRAGLSTMVSSRAADRILADALKGSGNDPDDVDQSQMRTALLGPVLHELERVLPRHGLKRNLERLARSLRDAPPGDEAAEAPRALLTGSIPADVVPLEPIDGEGAGPGWGPAATPGRTHRSRSQASPDELSAPAAGTATAVAEPPKVTPRLSRRLEDDELEEKVSLFAQIEHVLLVAGLRADGTIPVHRGDGLDLDLLSRLSRLTLSLLAKGGTLRSLHLGHSHGQLFLFPVGPDLLIVYGGPELNLGTVTTAFTALALEEEL